MSGQLLPSLSLSDSSYSSSFRISSVSASTSFTVKDYRCQNFHGQLFRIVIVLILLYMFKILLVIVWLINQNMTGYQLNMQEIRRINTKRYIKTLKVFNYGLRACILMYRLAAKTLSWCFSISLSLGVSTRYPEEQNPLLLNSQPSVESNRIFYFQTTEISL